MACGWGCLLPSASIDQYAGTLAKWFGVSVLELIGANPGEGVTPNLRNFGNTDYPGDLKFMV